MCRPEAAPSVFKPGELSTPHAQILSGTHTSNRCAACHRPAATSPDSWFQENIDGHRGVTQTDRCLDCHHNVIRRDRANLAHNVPVSVLASMSAEVRLVSSQADHGSRSTTWHDLMPGPAVGLEDVQCSACHREHRGMNASLLDVSDSQCQTCHADRFGSFATSHPEWNDWPYDRGATVAFNHQTHANKHYPSSQHAGAPIAFDCSGCHRVDSRGELARGPSYEFACQSCHDDSLQIEASEGIDLIALPTIPTESAERLHAWPENATGFYDGQVVPLAELLLRANSDSADASRHIPNSNFAEINADDPSMTDAATSIAREHRRLVAEIASKGQQSILNRAAQAGLPRDVLAELIRALPPQLLQQTYQQWFSVNGDPVLRQSASRDVILKRALRLVDYQDIAAQPPSILLAARPQDRLLVTSTPDDELLQADDDLLADQDSLADDDLLSDDDLLVSDDALLDSDELLLDDSDSLLSDDGDDLLSTNAAQGDPLADDLLAESHSVADVTEFPQRFDPTAMLPAGGWYRDDLKMTISYRGSGHSDPVLRSAVELLSQLPPSDPVRKRMLATRAVAACISCHPAAARETGQWRSAPLVGQRSNFTKFAHGPHLHIAQLADCSHCHVVRTPSRRTELNITLASGQKPERDDPEFEPLKLEACASCHTAKAAGDNCTKCHRYHIDF
tara:strand:+ start:25014 stop:27053 length:2040 start_codon:yes stop_codon:yes gene_type:complete